MNHERVSVDVSMMSRSASTKIAPGNKSSSLAGYAHRRRVSAPKHFDQLLELKSLSEKSEMDGGKSPGQASSHFSDRLQGLRRRCAHKHRNSRRETAGWDRIDHQEVFVLC
jgi:hypothetical protein